MLNAEADYVLRTIEERGIRFVRLWFTDVLGFLKSFTITSQELEGAFAEGMGFDGSSIEGYSRIQESDMVAVPDAATFQVIPWKTEHAVARMFCDIYQPDGTPFDGDPRGVLKRQLKRAADRPFEASRNEGYDHLFGVAAVLGAESAPHVRSDHSNPVGFHAGSGGEGVAGAVGKLGRGPLGEARVAIGPEVPARHRRTRLERTGREPMIPKRQLDGDITVREQVVAAFGGEAERGVGAGLGEEKHLVGQGLAG